jgi:hypothetical protein
LFVWAVSQHTHYSELNSKTNKKHIKNITKTLFIAQPLTVLDK